MEELLFIKRIGEHEVYGRIFFSISGVENMTTFERSYFDSDFSTAGRTQMPSLYSKDMLTGHVNDVF